MSRDTLDPTSNSTSATRDDGPGPDVVLADLRALRDRPIVAAAQVERRIHREARAAFIATFDDTPLFARLLRGAGRAAVPVVLASVVGIYLMWAIKTAAALVQ